MNIQDRLMVRAFVSGGPHLPVIEQALDFLDSDRVLVLSLHVVYMGGHIGHHRQCILDVHRLYRFFLCLLHYVLKRISVEYELRRWVSRVLRVKADGISKFAARVSISKIPEEDCVWAGSVFLWTIRRAQSRASSQSTRKQFWQRTNK